MSATASAPAAQAASPALSNRLLSLDVFRGATIAGMILVNNSGDGAHTYAPLRHAQWDGWTPTDLVFPFFLWIMGVAMTFSFASRLERGAQRQHLLLHVLRRAGILFALGLFLNGFPKFDLATLRIPGVLQRIAVCYLIAGAIYLFSETRGRLLWIAGLMSAYWALMKLAPVPGYGAGGLDLEGNFQQYIDMLVMPGHLYKPRWDPEGIVSTLPAIGNTLLGILCGTLLRSEDGAWEKVRGMIVAGAGLVITGLVCDSWLPINKNLWTVSFALFTSGMAFWGLAACYWLIDGKGWRLGTFPFVVFGMNAIAAYVLSGLVARIMYLTGWKAAVYPAVFAPLGSPYHAALLYALANVAVCYAAAWAMYRRNWFIRI